MTEDCTAEHPIYGVRCELTPPHRHENHEAQCDTFKAIWVGL